MELVQDRVVRVPVRLHNTRIREGFALPHFVVYFETEGVRFGPSGAYLNCHKCGSRLDEAGYGPILARQIALTRSEP